MSNGILGELFVALGFEVQDEKVDSFNQKTKTAENNLIKVAAVATAAAVALDKIVERAARGATALQNFAQQTGLSASKLQLFAVNAQLQNIGLTSESVSSSIMALQSNLAQIKIGQGNIAPFQLMGVDVLGQDAFSVIEQLRTKIQGLDDMTVTNLISQMGLDPQFITVLRMSSDEFGEFGKQVMLTSEQADKLQKLGQETRKLHLAIDALFNKTLVKAEPHITKFFETLTNIAFAIEKLNLGIPILILSLGGILNVFKLLNKQTLMWTAAIAGLLLLLDDFSVWQQGGKSLFDWQGVSDLQKNPVFGNNPIKRLSQVPNDIKEQGIGKWFGGQFSEINDLMHGRYVPNIMSPKSNKIEQTNNININSNATRGEDVARGLEPILNSSVLQLNNGGY
jgi:hypothetical protein